MITVTDSAIRQLQSIVEEKGEPGKGLRILVEHGGCAGMQYGMGLDEAKAGDEIVERDGVKVMVDPESVAYLRGATIDYCDDLTGTGFRIQNPNAVRSCGCGTSFETSKRSPAFRRKEALHGSMNTQTETRTFSGRRPVPSA